jgi:hypothetical protein
LQNEEQKTFSDKITSKDKLDQVFAQDYVETVKGMSDWRKVVGVSEKPYYYNVKTFETVYDLPE